MRRHPRHVVLFASSPACCSGRCPRRRSAAAVRRRGVAPPLGRPPRALPPRPRSPRPAPVGGLRVAAVLAALAVLAGAAVAAGAASRRSVPAALPALDGPADRRRARSCSSRCAARADGSAVARVRLAGRTAIAAGVAARSRPSSSTARSRSPGRRTGARRPARASGSELRLARHGRRRSATLDAYQRRRGAHAAVEVARWSATGRRARRARRPARRRPRARGARPRHAGWPPPRGGAAARHGARAGRGDRRRRAGRLPALGPRAPARRLGPERAAALRARARAVRGARRAAARRGWSPRRVLVALYVPLAGGGPSIQRAGVMGIAGLVAALAGGRRRAGTRSGSRRRSTLALNPLAAGDPGWQLSFAAVVGLLALAPPLRAALARRRAARAGRRRGGDHGRRDARDRAAARAALRAGVARLAAGEPARGAGRRAGHVARACWRWRSRRSRRRCALPLNVALRAAARLPRVGRARRGRARRSPRCRCGSAAPLGAGARVRRAARRRRGAAARRRRLARARGLRGAARRRGRRRGAADRCARRAAARRCSPWSRRGRRARVHALRERPAPPAPGELVVSFLDVGQGDAMLLQRDGAAVLVDTGPPRRADPAAAGRGGRRAARPARAHARRGRPRGDGAAGDRGVPAAAGARRRRRLADGGAARAARGARARRRRAVAAARAGQVLRLGALRLRRPVAAGAAPGLAAGRRPERPRRRRARRRTARFDLLLPADAESNVTAALDLPRRRGAQGRAPRQRRRRAAGAARAHARRGSRRSRSARNSYGHPAPSTLGALRAVPRLVRTDRDGTVRLRVARRPDAAGGRRGS